MSGFVYIWFDRKHKRYYIGCHWGFENDGYICSSTWMKIAYKRRPQDFKRRIIKNGFLSKNEMFAEEEKFLNLIKKEEFGKRYYNLQKHWHHWSTNEEKCRSVGAKISASPNRAKNIGLGNKGKKRTEAEKEHLRKIWLGTKRSIEDIQKIKDNHPSKQPGYISPLIGKKQTTKSNLKRSIKMKQIRANKKW